ncbi:Abi family protein [[Limnothrix rosea] IAM M-220]|uniref:Abi family protein n=1 Tax=[Limnothrix rosea] IAM M-220 TaxID=454133 RepID=UPI0009689BEE|nr:Abi family protein [[Limnothrix rosea] IAM M-220]OKH11180.1 DNA-binding protein [[Limnothrix rosea] IAM M-220]
MTRSFSKPALTLTDQINLLESRGLIVSDKAKAEFYLARINYYRLRAYCLPFEQSPQTHQFKTGTTFENVLDLYIFDRELRLHLLDAIERIEVSMRSIWAYELAHAYNPHAHLDRTLFDERQWVKNLAKLHREVERSNEDFIRHFKRTYSEALPPVWVAVEVMSLGSLSSWFGILKPRQARQKIATHYGINHSVLESWLHHLAIVRNICAHHSRLWNKEISVAPRNIRSSGHPLHNGIITSSKKIYNSLVILLYLMDQIAPNHQWGQKLLNHIKTCPQSLSAMDFPSDWESRQIWQR